MAFIKTDKTGRITAASRDFHCGKDEKEVCLPDDMKLEDIHNYRYIDNEFIYDPAPVDNTERIEELRQNLRDSADDILQIIEGTKTLAECADIIQKRKEWRKELAELEERRHYQ